ncbi:DNA polymerase eta [Zea mays]|uniref:DNA polymerase eta n=1 Tax=Zea mays TaxID=4577 RepID=A0A1D6GTV9_MAIZE|nr:DNA polymerase eta [Zea mays]
MGGGGPHSAELSAQSRRQGASEYSRLKHTMELSLSKIIGLDATLGAIYVPNPIPLKYAYRMAQYFSTIDGPGIQDYSNANDMQLALAQLFLGLVALFCMVNIDWGRLLRNHGISDSEKVLIFFDDHQSELKRLKQALKAGFRHLIFEDNYDTGTCDHYFLRHIYDPSYIRAGDPLEAGSVIRDLEAWAAARVSVEVAGVKHWPPSAARQQPTGVPCRWAEAASDNSRAQLSILYLHALQRDLYGPSKYTRHLQATKDTLREEGDITPPTGIRQAMEMQAEVERRICAQVLESEGKKQAQFDHLLYCSRAAEEPGAQGIANRRGAVQWLERRRLDCRQLRGSWIWSMRGDEAKRVCPGINLVQVPVARGKANLNLYRSAGAEVVAILASKGKCERASIDEVYLDLTDAAKEMLLQAPPDSPEGIFMEAAKSNILGLPADASEKEKNVRAWLCQSEADYQDKLLACGAIIVAQLRVRVLEETQFTCSAGIAHNKMLAKLVSGMYKPAQQTVVPSSSVQDLLASLPVKKMKQLGGKLGSSLQDDLGVETIGDLLSFTEEKLQEQYGVNTG